MLQSSTDWICRLQMAHLPQIGWTQQQQQEPQEQEQMEATQQGQQETEQQVQLLPSHLHLVFRGAL